MAGVAHLPATMERLRRPCRELAGPEQRSTQCASHAVQSACKSSRITMRGSRLKCLSQEDSRLAVRENIQPDSPSHPFWVIVPSHSRCSNSFLPALQTYESWVMSPSPTGSAAVTVAAASMNPQPCAAITAAGPLAETAPSLSWEDSTRADVASRSVTDGR